MYNQPVYLYTLNEAHLSALTLQLKQPKSI